ncbi:MAG: HIT family protein [Saezia sp.]
MQMKNCVLCESDGGVLVADTEHWRVIRATDQKGFPCVYRVIWEKHVAEFSDLSSWEREHCMHAVAWVEQAVRDYLKPDKVNLAALGNMVPHLHWHIIARYEWDSHFPNPVWGQAVREVPLEMWEGLRDSCQALECYLKDNVTEFIKV